MSTIRNISTYLPPYALNKDELCNWFEHSFNDAGALRKIRHLISENGIEQKHFVIPDFTDNTHSEALYKQNGKGVLWPSLPERMEGFSRAVTHMGVEAAEQCLSNSRISKSKVTHFISVSCTGLEAPGPEIQIPVKLGLSNDIERTAVNFMGCYAALHAIRMADRICKASPESNVLIVCAEACSMHYLNDPARDNLLAGVLFSDGASALIMTGNEPCETGWEPLAYNSQLVPESEKDMGWHLGKERFEMTLTSKIPSHVETYIESFCQNLTGKAGLKTNPHHYAVHPGGKNILKAVQNAMHIEDELMASGYEVLRKYGNMSSPTMLFVLKEVERLIGNTATANKPHDVLTAAFGPGLMIEGIMFRYYGHPAY